MNDQPAARILERGYRRYEGARRDRTSSATSLAVNSLQRALGIRRSAASKILPVLSILLAYLPATAFVGLVALLPRPLRNIAPAYHQYFTFITVAIFLFCALVAPEILCADRRTGMLSLYYSSPLSPATYLLAKAAAVMVVLGFVTLGPPLLLMLAYTMEGVGPGGPGDLALALGRILVAGTTLALIYGTVSLAVSSLTDRRAFASAGIVLLILVPNAVAGILVNGLDAPEWIGLLTLTDLPFELVQRVFGQEGSHPDVATLVVAAGWLAAVVAGIAVLAFRYRRESAST